MTDGPRSGRANPALGTRITFRHVAQRWPDVHGHLRPGAAGRRRLARRGRGMVGDQQRALGGVPMPDPGGATVRSSSPDVDWTCSPASIAAWYRPGLDGEIERAVIEILQGRHRDGVARHPPADRAAAEWKPHVAILKNGSAAGLTMTPRRLKIEAEDVQRGRGRGVQPHRHRGPSKASSTSARRTPWHVAVPAPRPATSATAGTPGRAGTASRISPRSRLAPTRRGGPPQRRRPAESRSERHLAVVTAE
jgi:hypothetical protein